MKAPSKEIYRDRNKLRVVRTEDWRRKMDRLGVRGKRGRVFLFLFLKWIKCSKIYYGDDCTYV